MPQPTYDAIVIGTGPGGGFGEPDRNAPRGASPNACRTGIWALAGRNRPISPRADGTTARRPATVDPKTGAAPRRGPLPVPKDLGKYCYFTIVILSVNSFVPTSVFTKYTPEATR